MAFSIKETGIFLPGPSRFSWIAAEKLGMAPRVHHISWSLAPVPACLLNTICMIGNGFPMHKNTTVQISLNIKSSLNLYLYQHISHFVLLVHLGIQWNLLGVLRKGCWMALGRRSLASHHSLPGINGMYSATWDDCDGWTCHWRKLNQSWNHIKIQANYPAISESFRLPITAKNQRFPNKTILQNCISFDLNIQPTIQRSEVLVPHGEGSLMVFLSDYSGWAWAVLQKNGGKNAMQFQYHSFVEVFFCQNCGRTHPTFTKTHPLKMSHTQTKVCEQRHRHILWHANACYTILLHTYITISWHTSYYHHINMKLYDITENRTSHFNYI